MFVSIQRGSYKSRVCAHSSYRSAILTRAGLELFREFVPACMTLCSDIVELDNNEDIVMSDIT